MLSGKDIPLFSNVFSIVFVSLPKLEFGRINFFKTSTIVFHIFIFFLLICFCIQVLYSIRGLYKKVIQSNYLGPFGWLLISHLSTYLGQKVTFSNFCPFFVVVEKAT